MNLPNSDEMKKVIRHALGLPFSRPEQFRHRWSYRNYYAGAPGGDVMCERLVELGYMRVLDTIRDSRIYGVTDAGIMFAGLDHKVRREDRLAP